MNTITIAITHPQKDYELLDSGEGEKLERYGAVILSRPDPQALWDKRQTKEWKNAHAVFSRDAKSTEWIIKKNIPCEWTIEFDQLNFLIKPTPFKHTGLFPEQSQNWQWMRELISKRKKPVNVLNLFGYTGGATLACAQAGASVCHVDGSKTAIGWAKKNAELSGLEKKPIRWILDDAMQFVKREIKRGRRYEGIVMDPPAFGHGPGGELWKFEKQFPELLSLCKEVLSDKPLFILINAYASGYSAIALENNLNDLMLGIRGMVEIGELAIEESLSKRLLPCGIFGRWQNADCR